MDENKIALAVAEQEFDRFTDAMDLDVDTSVMDEEDLKGFTQQKRVLIRAIQKGSLVINDDGEPVFKPQGAEDDVNALTFHEHTGASLMAMDRKKKTEDVGKLYSIMGDMTKTNANLFSKMAGRDIKVCTAIVTLYLG